MTEAATRRKFLEMMDGIPFGAVVTNERILEIMQCHPQFKRKSRNGTSSLRKVRHHPSFMLVFCDGTDLSYRTAIKAYLGLKTTKPYRSFVTRAARSEIQPQIWKYRQDHGIMSPDIEVDHTRYFIVLLEAWLSQEGLTDKDIKIKKSGRYLRFLHRGLARSWRDYHRANATYQAVSREDHTKLTVQRRKGVRE